MANTDEFVWGLAGGLVILAALLLIFSTSWSSSGTAYGGSGGISWFGPAYGSYGGSGSSGPAPVLVAAGAPGSEAVGTILDSQPTQISLGRFELASEQATIFPAGRVESGLLFESKSMIFNVYNPTTMQFTVRDTNGYGSLAVYVDDQPVFETKDRGTYSVGINRLGAVKIEIVASSSGWKLWAPALYDLGPVTIRTAKPFADFTFGADTNVGRAELDLTMDRAATISITLNDRVVWVGPAPTRLAVSLPLTALRSGNNKVSINVISGSTTGTAKLNLWFKTEKRFEMKFTLSDSDAALLPGRIAIEVPAVINRGAIAVKVVSGSGEARVMESFTAAPGTFSVSLNSNSIRPGENTVIVEGADNAAFYIRNVKVFV